jgi:hypothetical protein
MSLAESAPSPPVLPPLRPMLAVAFGLAAVKILLHLWLIERYGYHRDELYFIECGRRLAFGYVDHAPLVPWIAAAAGLFDHDLFALRLPSVIAGATSVGLTVWLTRSWGGGRLAQLVSGLAVLGAPAFLRMSKILCIPVFEPLCWTGAALVITHILRGASPRWWLGLGALVGVGLLTKHSMLFWALGFVVGAVLTPGLRHWFRTPWPYLGGLVSLLLFAPNLVWQGQHDWATLQFLREISEGMLARIPRALYVGGQFLYMNPLATPIWLAGLWWLFSQAGREYRIFAWIFVTVFVVQLLMRSKPYYLAPAFPSLLAAGASLIERISRKRRWLGPAAVANTVAAVIVGSLLSLPIVSLSKMDQIVERVLGWAVPPIALTHDLHDEYGWAEQAQVVARVRDAALLHEERARAIVLTGNYGEASAIQFFGPKLELPPATTGHMTYYVWGLPVAEPSAVIAYGIPLGTLNALFEQVSLGSRVDHALAVPSERHLPIYVCRRPRRPLPEIWPSLRRYGNDPLRRDTKPSNPGGE